uniref:Outer membrane lipoprotein BamD-like domain-containing protein n=1 Tax=uncultured delta proteobacterium TaxID=34034 RepID=Q2YZT9_9DELT|nr:hypothetical protein [uncultured delta proteobacterium]
MGPVKNSNGVIGMMISGLKLKNFRIILIILSVFFACSVSSCATRQDVIYLNKQINNLKNRIDQLTLEQNKKLDSTLLPLMEFQSNITPMIESMEADIRLLRGDIESLDHRSNEIEKNIKTFEIKKIKNTDEINIDDTNIITTNNDHKPIMNFKKFPEDKYAEAKELYDKGLYKESKKAFEDFMGYYPEDKLTGNSQFWIAEIYFKEGDYKKSIFEYQKLMDNFKGHPKVPSAYLKQGLAYYKIDDSFTGKLILEKLIKLFPGTEQANTAKNKLKD